MKAVSLTSHQHPVDKGEGLFSFTISRHIRTILRKTLCCLFPHKEANYSSLPTEWQHPDMMSLSTNAHPFILFLPLHLFKSPSPLVTASQVIETTSNATLWPTRRGLTPTSWAGRRSACISNCTKHLVKRKKAAVQTKLCNRHKPLFLKCIELREPETFGRRLFREPVLGCCQSQKHLL